VIEVVTRPRDSIVTLSWLIWSTTDPGVATSMGTLGATGVTAAAASVTITEINAMTAVTVNAAV